jgi:hypothetical protein
LGGKQAICAHGFTKGCPTCAHFAKVREAEQMNRRNFLGLAAPAAAASAVGVSTVQALTLPDDRKMEMVSGAKANWKPIKQGRLPVCSNCGCEVNGYLVADPRDPAWSKGVCLECEAILKVKVDLAKQSAEDVRRGILRGFIE